MAQDLEKLTHNTAQVEVFWVLPKPCRIPWFQRFMLPPSFHFTSLHFTSLYFTLLHPEDGSNIGLRNAGILPQHYTASQPKRLRLESSPPRKPQISYEKVIWFLFLEGYKTIRVTPNNQLRRKTRILRFIRMNNFAALQRKCKFSSNCLFKTAGHKWHWNNTRASSNEINHLVKLDYSNVWNGFWFSLSHSV